MERMEMVRCDAYSITLGSNFAKQVQSIRLHVSDTGQLKLLYTVL